SATSRGGVNPSCASITNLYSPDLSLKYETYLPSGDHAGSRSAEPLELLRFRTSPFSAGMVKISPPASTPTAFAGGRERDVRHPVRHVFPARHHPREIARGRDVYDARFPRFWIEFVDVA